MKYQKCKKKGEESTSASPQSSVPMLAAPFGSAAGPSCQQQQVQKNSVTAPPIVFRGGVAAPLCQPILDKNGLVQPRHEWDSELAALQLVGKKGGIVTQGSKKTAKKTVT